MFSTVIAGALIFRKQTFLMGQVFWGLVFTSFWTHQPFSTAF